MASVDGSSARRGSWFAAALLLLLGMPAAWNLSTWPSRVRYPGELGDNVEGVCLAETLHLRGGVAVYAPVTPDRFEAMIYGPLYYWLGAKLIDPENPAYRPLRVLSLFATLGCIGAVALMAFRLSHSGLAAVLAGLLVLSYGLVSTVGLSARCDVVALALVFWGFVVAHRYRGSRGVLVSVPLIVLGLFFKQQYVAPPLAVFLYLLLDRRWRLAAEFAGLTILSGGALLAYFHFVVYPGQSLLWHLVDYSMISLSWNRFGWGLLLFVIFFGVLTLLGLEFLRRHPDRLISTYLGCAVFLAVVTLAKEGSGTNYYLEPLLTICPPVAALAAECRKEAGRRVEILCLLAVSLLVGTPMNALPPSPRDFVLDRSIQNYLRSNFKPGTLAAGVGVATGELVRAGLDVPVSNFYQYTWLACRGTIPPAQLVAQFGRHRFGVVAIRLNLQDEQQAHQPNDVCLTEDLHRAILLNYRLVAALDLPVHQQLEFPTRLYLWVPQGGPGREETQTGEK